MTQQYWQWRFCTLPSAPPLVTRVTALDNLVHRSIMPSMIPLHRKSFFQRGILCSLELSLVPIETIPPHLQHFSGTYPLRMLGSYCTVFWNEDRPKVFHFGRWFFYTRDHWLSILKIIAIWFYPQLMESVLQQLNRARNRLTIPAAMTLPDLVNTNGAVSFQSTPSFKAVIFKRIIAFLASLISHLKNE